VSGTPFHVEVLRDLGVGVAHGKQKVVLAKYFVQMKNSTKKTNLVFFYFQYLFLCAFSR
jgi:hypothetical protein